ncbi:hypothetical protein V9T40_000415 [Parthenolecanium corni]|uniref:Uncharacterized protein n=1 Tax=Parthenolecanium corni TaxID=536013 RepID=A0AAN9TB10_9HEMI
MTMKTSVGYPNEITSRTSLTLITFSEFLRVLRQNPIQYSLEMGALVDGDELYSLEGDLSTDCKATIMAYTRMILNWTSYPDIFFSWTLNNLRESRETKHPFESVCVLVEGQINRTSKVGDFVRLKESLIPKITAKSKYYFDKLLETDEDMERVSNKIFRITGVAKMLVNEEFRKQRYSQTAYTKEAHIFAKSLEVVASRGKYKAHIQNIFNQVLKKMTEVVGQITSMRDLVLQGHRTYTFTPSMLQLLQKHVEEDPDLKLELENARKLVMATLKYS